MTFRLPVYVVVKPTGQYDEDGTELVILLAVKLNKTAADQLIDKNPGARIEKLIADKFTD